MSLPLVTRFGADPLLDLEVANKRYVDNNASGALQMMAQAFHDTITNTEGSGYYQAINAASPTVRTLSFAIAGTMALYAHEVELNNNTVDGAVFNMQVNNTTVNGAVVIDQATGFFQDLTNSDVVIVGDNQNWIYVQGNNFVNNLSSSCRFTPS